MWTPRLLQSRLSWESVHNYRQWLINNIQQHSTQQHQSKNEKKKKWAVGGDAAAGLDAQRSIPALSVFIGAFVCAKSKGVHKVKPASKPRVYFYIQ